MTNDDPGAIAISLRCGAREDSSNSAAGGNRTVRPGLAAALLAALAVVLAGGIPSAYADPGQPARIAILDIPLLKADYLPNAGITTAVEQARLDVIMTMLAERLAAEGYAIVPRADVRAATRAADPGQYLHECNGCERDIARAVGANWVLVGWVQYISNLILNLNVVIYDIDTGAIVTQAFVDLRGNTERSWRHATRYLLDRVLIARLRERKAAAGAAASDG